MTERNKLPSYNTLIHQAQKQLDGLSDSPKIDAEVLMQHVLGKSLSWLIGHGNNKAEEGQIDTFLDLLEQRRQGQPIAYLVGHKEFWSLSLAVNDAVLVPRADTETLVERAIEYLEPRVAPRVLDLGTGSGAIAVALAKSLPRAHITAVDVSTKALEVARYNANRHGLGHIEFILSDWFSELQGRQFELIAANPPYVAADDLHLQQGDLRFEPNVALISKADGYADLQHIISMAGQFLCPNGVLIVEHGATQASRIAAYFADCGFADIGLYRDLNDHPRCTSGVWQA